VICSANSKKAPGRGHPHRLATGPSGVVAANRVTLMKRLDTCCGCSGRTRSTSRLTLTLVDIELDAGHPGKARRHSEWKIDVHPATATSRNGEGNNRAHRSRWDQDDPCDRRGDLSQPTCRLMARSGPTTSSSSAPDKTEVLYNRKLHAEALRAKRHPD
jgi:hypothetical protein